ncbi:MAG: type IX secretion system PorP/SprF family membrane protein [Crocinitomicaceae bacterium]|jgi:type IX secretion system PorP/SprF family membrane protein
MTFLKKSITLLVIGLGTVSYAQQMPQYSQYLRNQYMVNPGAAGMYDFLDITIGGRMQWLGFETSPRTTYLYASTVLNKPKVRYNPHVRTSQGVIRNPEVQTGRLKHAIGGQLLADEYGAYRKLSITGTYALHIPLSKNYNMSFGVNAGLSNNAFMQERAIVLTEMGGYSGPAMTDLDYQQYVLNQGNLNYLDIGAGLFVYSKNLFFGISAADLTKSSVSFGTGSMNFDPRIHFNGTLGYKFSVSDDVTLMPALLAKYMAPAPLSIEGSLQIEYKEWLWFGLSYRSSNTAVAMAGLNISEKFKFGYSFDFSLNPIRNYSVGGHEIVLGLMIGR